MVIVVKKMMVVTVGHECAQDVSNLSNNTFFCRRAAILSVQRNNKRGHGKGQKSQTFFKNCSKIIAVLQRSRLSATLEFL